MKRGRKDNPGRKCNQKDKSELKQKGSKELKYMGKATAWDSCKKGGLRLSAGLHSLSFALKARGSR